MGGGQIIEHGTHADLLRKGGDYARLVQAQKLRETDHQERAEDLQEQLAREEIPLDRKYTAPSATSDILENRRKAAEATGNTKKEEDSCLPSVNFFFVLYFKSFSKKLSFF